MLIAEILRNEEEIEGALPGIRDFLQEPRDELGEGARESALDFFSKPAAELAGYRIAVVRNDDEDGRIVFVCVVGWLVDRAYGFGWGTDITHGLTAYAALGDGELFSRAYFNHAVLRRFAPLPGTGHGLQPLRP